MRGFTVNGVKFRVEENGYFANIGNGGAWVFIRPRTGAYEYSASVLSGITHYVTDKPVKEVAVEVLQRCANKAKRAHEAFSGLAEPKERT